jgi:hypothetical protein
MIARRSAGFHFGRKDLLVHRRLSTQARIGGQDDIDCREKGIEDCLPRSVKLCSAQQTKPTTPDWAIPRPEVDKGAWLIQVNGNPPIRRFRVGAQSGQTRQC